MDHVCKHIDMKQPAAAVAVSVKRYAATTPVQCAWKRYAALTQVHSVRISGMPLLHRCTVTAVAVPGFVETLRFYLGTAIGIKLLNTQCSEACL